MSNSKIGADIAVIKNQISNLCSNFEEYKNDNKKLVQSLSDKQNTLENKQIVLDQKVSLMSAFQSVFSIVVGGIATYLGTKK